MNIFIGSSNYIDLNLSALNNVNIHHYLSTEVMNFKMTHFNFFNDILQLKFSVLSKNYAFEKPVNHLHQYTLCHRHIF